MTIILTLLPHLFSFLLGFFALSIINHKEKNIPSVIYFVLSLSIGLGISAQITFLSFILFNSLIPFFILSFNLLLLFTLGYYYFLQNPVSCWNKVKIKKKIPQTIFLIAATFILLIPLLKHSQFYVHGGWDAWSVWNVKAKFLYLGGSSWDNMFQPILWRSSPHYPLLLPLINVWGWIFTQASVYYVPQLTAIVFTILVVYFLCFAIKDLTKSPLSFIPALLFLSSPFVIKQCISQYCDLIFGFYLLSASYCLLKAKENK